MDLGIVKPLVKYHTRRISRNEGGEDKETSLCGYVAIYLHGPRVISDMVLYAVEDP